MWRLLHCKPCWVRATWGSFLTMSSLEMQEERDAERLKRIKERIQEEEAQRAQEAKQGASADVELI